MQPLPNQKMFWQPFVTIRWNTSFRMYCCVESTLDMPSDILTILVLTLYLAKGMKRLLKIQQTLCHSLFTIRRYVMQKAMQMGIKITVTRNSTQTLGAGQSTQLG